MGMFVVAPTKSFHSQYHHEGNYVVGDGNNAATTLGVGVGVIPLFSTTAADEIARSRAETWENQNQNQNQNQQQLVGFSTTKNEAEITATCQDCGNQSKKDCSHQRCRTCCRSRGFDCVTHVKSTWIPAARRRERQTAGTGGGDGGGASSGSTSEAKKPRLISSQTTSNNSTCNTPPPCFDTSSSRQVDASFKETLPGQVRAPAVFKCVKVTAIEDEEDEFAYQAIVKIGGHLFKGFLYDQGVVQKDGFPNLSDLHLGASSGGRNVAFESSPHPYQSDVYGASGVGGGGLLGGSSYGNTIN